MLFKDVLLLFGVFHCWEEVSRTHSYYYFAGQVFSLWLLWKSLALGALQSHYDMARGLDVFLSFFRFMGIPESENNCVSSRSSGTLTPHFSHIPYYPFQNSDLIHIKSSLPVLHESKHLLLMIHLCICVSLWVTSSNLSPGSLNCPINYLTCCWTSHWILIQTIISFLYASSTWPSSKLTSIWNMLVLFTHTVYFNIYIFAY